MSSFNYKNFTLNSTGDEAPWSDLEVQFHKDIIDTCVKDCYSAVMDVTNGHRHYRLWDTSGVVGVRCSSTGVQRFEYSASVYTQLTTDSSGDTTIKNTGGYFYVANTSGTPVANFNNTGDLVLGASTATLNDTTANVSFRMGERLNSWVSRSSWGTSADFYLAYNAYMPTVGTFKHIGSDYASTLKMGYGGTIAFQVADTGAAASDITWLPAYGISSSRDHSFRLGDAAGTRTLSIFDSNTTICHCFTSAKNFGIGTLTFDATGVSIFTIKNGTAPGGHVDDQIQIFSTDSADNTATLGLYLEQAVEADTSVASTHKIKISLNGVAYYLYLKTV